MNVSIRTNKETRYCTYINKVVIEIDEDFVVTVEDTKDETLIEIQYPDDMDFEPYRLIKAHRVDTDGEL